MKIACLQIASELGAFEANVQRAERCLAKVRLGQIDYLVLPEMVFSGYNFPSLESILPFLEPTASGPSTAWAIATARRLKCVVTVGYPEIATSATSSGDEPRRYNAIVTVSPTEEVLAHYRKSFLYYTDETWASEGSGFYVGTLRLSMASSFPASKQMNATMTPMPFGDGGMIRVAAGICMDINPYKFTAPWQAYEFAQQVITTHVELVVLSMAWLSHALALAPEQIEGDFARQPDLETLSYWTERFQPVVDGDEDVVVVCANRCGREGDVIYAGTSTVLLLGKGRIRLWEVLGRAEEGCLVVDTGQAPCFELQMVRRSTDDGSTQ